MKVGEGDAQSTSESDIFRDGPMLFSVVFFFPFIKVNIPAATLLQYELAWLMRVSLLLG